MSYSEGHSQQAVNNILSSIRQMISEENYPLQDSSDKSSIAPTLVSDLDTSQEQILELTRLIREDGSVVELASQNPSKEDSSPGLPNDKIKQEYSTKEELMEKKAEIKPSFSSNAQANLNEEPSFSSQSYAQPHNQHTPSQYPSQPQAMSAPFFDANSFQLNSFEDTVQNNLMSADTLQESAAAFANLSKAIEKRASSESKNPTAATIADYTVDNLIRELLRPLLKEWIDAHLPSLVRTVVLEQIEKVLQLQKAQPAA